MMEAPEKNPPLELGYAATMAPRLEVPYMRAGKFLVTGANAVLPGRCVLCGAVAEGLPVGVRIRVVNSFEFRLTSGLYAHLGLSYCRRHGQMRRWARRAQIGFAVMAVAGLVAFVAMIWTGADERRELAMVGVTGLLWGLASVVAACGCAVVVTSRGPVFHHRVGDLFYFAGVSPKFLATLQENPRLP